MAFALLMLLASDSAAAQEPQAVLLSSSESIQAEVDAAERRRLLHSLPVLRFRPVTTAISPQELDASLAANPTASPASPENRLLEVDVEARPPRAQQAPLQSRIPFGLAAIVWGFRHPSEAWRIFLPIPSETSRAAPASHAATGPGRHGAEWKSAVKVA